MWLSEIYFLLPFRSEWLGKINSNQYPFQIQDQSQISATKFWRAYSQDNWNQVHYTWWVLPRDCLPVFCGKLAARERGSRESPFGWLGYKILEMLKCLNFFIKNIFDKHTRKEGFPTYSLCSSQSDMLLFNVFTFHFRYWGKRCSYETDCHWHSWIWGPH